MNKQLFRQFALVGLIALPMIGGCKPVESQPDAFPGTNAPPAPAPAAATNTPAPVTTNTVTAPPVGSGQPEVPLAVNRPIPDHLSVSAALDEVIKLTQAGVAEDILLAFVNNAGSSFRLGADEIIFLTDLGIPSIVINSMMERDRVLGAGVGLGFPSPAAATSATEAVAVAPAYEEMPAAETETVSMAGVETITAEDFEDTLSPYGTWIDIEGYGRCWQPTVVVANPAWRPYCDGGRWIYTDVGWYWYSDYTWGWAPFHYGRWFSHPRWGWCWYPDYTWGPAWVTWSYTDTYCGWAPLPPAAVYTETGFTYFGSAVSVGFGFGLGYSYYSYVPWRYFCDYRPWRYCAPRPHCKEIYDRATCHNDYGKDRHRRTVNRGLPPERVSRYAQTEVRQVRLRDVPETRPSGGRQEELASDGRTLAVQRPVAPSATGSPRARALRENTTLPATTSDVTISTRGTRPQGTVAPAPTGSNPEAVGPTTIPRRQVRSRADGAPSSTGSPSGRQPLVVVGNGDGLPPSPSAWTPYDTQPTRPNPREVIAITAPVVETHPQPAPEAPINLPPQTWTPPGRSNPGGQTQPQVIRVNRSVQDRPGGGSNYRVYSSPQREASETPSFDPSPTTSTAPGRSPNSEPSTPPGNSESTGGENYQPERPQNTGSTRSTERSTSQRPPPSDPPPIRPETRTTPAPSRSEGTRSDANRSESRPTQNDTGRGGVRGR